MVDCIDRKSIVFVFVRVKCCLWYWQVKSAKKNDTNYWCVNICFNLKYPMICFFIKWNFKYIRNLHNILPLYTSKRFLLFSIMILHTIHFSKYIVGWWKCQLPTSITITGFCYFHHSPLERALLQPSKDSRAPELFCQHLKSGNDIKAFKATKKEFIFE